MMRKHHVRFVLKWTLCLGLLAFAFSKADLANLRAHLRQVDGRWLAAGLGLCALNNASSAKQFQAGLAPLGMALSFWRISAIVLISAFYSMVVPAGMVAGGFASFYKIGKAGGRYLEAGALVVALRLLNTLLLVAFGLAGAFCERPWLEGAGRWITIAFAAGLCLAIWPFADPRIAQTLLLRLRVNPLGFGARLHDGLRAFECLVAGDRLRILAWGLARQRDQPPCLGLPRPCQRHPFAGLDPSLDRRLPRHRANAPLHHRRTGCSRIDLGRPLGTLRGSRSARPGLRFPDPPGHAGQHRLGRPPGTFRPTATKPRMNESRLIFRITFLWALWLSLEHWVFGDLSYLHVHDNADQLIPVFSWLTQSPDRLFGARLLPVLCGVDRFACSAWVHLFHVPFLFLPGWAANGLVLFTQRWVAGYFAARVSRDLFRFPLWIAVLVGLAYPLAPVEQGELRLMHGLNEPGFPLLLWVFGTMSLRSWPRLLAQAACLGVFLSLCLDPVSAMPFLLPTAVLVAGILRPEHRRPRMLLRLAAFLAVMSLAYLPFLWPPLGALARQAGSGHRGDWGGGGGFASLFLLRLRPILFGLMPWCGIVLLSAPFFLRPRFRERRWLALGAMLMVGLFLGSILQATAALLDDRLGLLRGFNFGRFERVLPLALLLLAAWGLEWFAGRMERRVRIPVVPVVFAIAATLAFSASWQIKRAHWQGMAHEGKTWRALLGNRDVAALAANTRGEEPFRVATAGAYHLLHPQYWLPHNLEMADGYMVMYPERYQQFWNKVVAPLVTTQPELAGHFSRWGSRVYLFHSRLPEDEHLPAIPFDAWYNRNLLSLANTRYLISRKPLDAPGLILLPPAVPDAERETWEGRGALSKALGYLRNENPGRRYFIYENPEAFPRARAVAKARYFPDTRALFDALAVADVSELRDTAFVVAGEADASLFSGDPTGNIRVDWERNEPGHLRLRIRGDRAAVLVLGQSFLPGWRFSIPGTTLASFPVNGAFTGVAVPAGENTVEAHYLPRP
jgi:hypothetical protein